MFSTDIQIRVRYAETDQMGYVYYGNYATYFEVARVEALRSLGVTYSELEKQGVMMPVLELKTKFIRPAKYDQVLTIRIYIKKLPTVRVVFEYEVFNEAQELLTVAETTLVFVDAHTMKPTHAPNSVTEALNKYLTE
jgi:acyl-CoA thioester hydrolase